MSRRKPKAGARRCSFVLENGSTCSAYALRDSSEDEPLCRVHAEIKAGTWSETARRMAKAQQYERRAKTEAKPRSGLAPHVTLAEVLAVVAPALEANDPFLPEQPCWAVRLAAAGTLLAAFPGYLRDTPEKVAALLRELLPEQVFDSSQHEAAKVYAALRASWDQLDGLRWSRLSGLYVKPYPAYMVEPWLSPEEVAKIQAERPAPVAPDRADVLRLEGGRVALKRPDAFPLLLPVEEPDDDSVDIEEAVPAW